MSSSPDGQAHPGEILHIDHVTDRTWTVPASQVPQSIAWELDAKGAWVPVIKVEILGSLESRTIISYGPEGQALKSLTQAPPPPR